MHRCGGKDCGEFRSRRRDESKVTLLRTTPPPPTIIEKRRVHKNIPDPLPSNNVRVLGPSKAPAVSAIATTDQSKTPAADTPVAYRALGF